VKRILRVNATWQQGRISLQQLVAILNYPSELKSERLQLEKVTGAIRFENVSFNHPDGKPILQHLSFCAEPSSITLIKGRQGSGKSTLLKLIMWIYDPTSGDIFLDAENYKTLSPFLVRKNVTIVSDEMPLLGSTVFQAVSYSRGEGKRSRVMRTLDQLKFSIHGDPETDLDAKIGEHGKNLSSGQQKLLKIARALNTSKKVILLDEPFDDLDASASKNLVGILNSLKRKEQSL
jgi:ABC-type bacteriocin/lantibiotic exporter with double-glycine peptidase domain